MHSQTSKDVWLAAGLERASHRLVQGYLTAPKLVEPIEGVLFDPNERKQVAAVVDDVTFVGLWRSQHAEHRLLRLFDWKGEVVPAVQHENGRAGAHHAPSDQLADESVSVHRLFRVVGKSARARVAAIAAGSCSLSTTVTPPPFMRRTTPLFDGGCRRRCDETQNAPIRSGRSPLTARSPSPVIDSAAWPRRRKQLAGRNQRARNQVRFAGRPHEGRRCPRRASVRARNRLSGPRGDLRSSHLSTL